MAFPTFPKSKNKNKLPVATPLDLSLKTREQKLELDELKSQKESALRDAEAVVKAVDELLEKRTGLEGTINSLETDIEKIVEFSKSVVESCIEEIKTADGLLQEFKTAIEESDKKLEQQYLHLTRVKEESATAHAQIMKENKILFQNKRDLDVYRGRLQAYIDKVDAPIKLLL